MSDQLFVYGSLMKNFYNYDKYLRGHVVAIEDGYVSGTLYDMPYKGYPALLDGTTRVHGEVITVKDINAVLPAMDAMEGFFGKDDDEYKRIPREVTLNSGEVITLDVYFYHAHDFDIYFEEQAILIPNGDWRDFKENHHNK
ncbi:gamma-glutamylcyclotransferase [Erysipelothrix sp. HDW6C]|uniref:gamma-glutamylcyclotransferase family protein n=1 Tax=Erysipelothrix sp. HDW6C TaxID=2714930 RepID=UPI0014073C51|nr:gamma-glutamylcyclotransferase family protein [Erysipelothrix sp. HDW6C]QIK69744.1 gamma-glutamylcyclotransferase [Erysipelothrix sp. HDW6C]